MPQIFPGSVKVWSKCFPLEMIFRFKLSFRMRLAALALPVLLAAGLAFKINVGSPDGYRENPADVSPKLRSSLKTKPFVLVLGIAQDAGFPQAGCQKDCCRAAWRQPQKRRMVSCLALVDPAAGEAWLFDATPDFPEQLHRLENVLPQKPVRLAGIFLTHAHVGHYSGLMHLGREAMNAKATPVYAMPRMRSFLSQNAPWNLLSPMIHT
ncbi:MAG: MBL fold metallo-hydrolase [Bacteroidota bacterium]